MPRVKLVLEYDGTNYVGWQVQANGPSIHLRVQEALEARGRTHQPLRSRPNGLEGPRQGQVVAFDSPCQLPLKAYRLGLNSLLPDDIAVCSAEAVADDFDPRRGCEGKRYRYLVSNYPSRSPLRRHTHWQIFQQLLVPPMAEGARHLVGSHDFSAFRASDCQAAHARRVISRLDVTGTSGEEIVFLVEGTAFLKHMVRNLVGTLIEVGRGRQSAEWMREVLEGRDRRKAGPTAPPQGLCLDEVFYLEDVPGRR